MKCYQDGNSNSCCVYQLDGLNHSDPTFHRAHFLCLLPLLQTPAQPQQRDRDVFSGPELALLRKTEFLYSVWDGILTA